MKFICSQQELIKNLNIVSKAVSVRTTIPTLKGILLTVENGNLKMTASDMDITIEVNMNVHSEEDGSIVVPAKLFIEYIRKLPQDDVEISTNSNIINVKCLTSSSSITGMDGSEFPVIKNDEYDKLKIVLDKYTLSKMIKNTSFAASIDQTKGALTGVLLEINEDNIRTVAIDGFRMAINTVNIENERKEKFIIYSKLADEINKIFSDVDTEEVELYYDDKNALIVLDNVKVSVRFIAGEFIKYQDILPKDYKINIELNRKEMINAVDRAAIMTEGKNNLIRISVKDNVMTISSNSEEGGSIEDILIRKTGDDIEIGFNARYMLEILRVIEDDDIVINMNTHITPCVIKPQDGDRFTYLILPVRINN